MIYPEIKSRETLKYEAKAALAGNWANAIGFIIIYYIIVALSSCVLYALPLEEEYSSLISFLISIFVISPLSFGFIKYFWLVSRGERPKYITILDPFRYYAVVFYTQLIRFALAIIPLLLFVPLGLIFRDYRLVLVLLTVLAAMAYFIYIFIIVGLFSMIEYIVNENPKISVIDIYKKCYGYMKYNWGKFIVLQLSFIGWALLAAITCGIGGLWLLPYVQTTNSRFYENIKQHYDGIEQIVQEN